MSTMQTPKVLMQFQVCLFLARLLEQKKSQLHAAGETSSGAKAFHHVSADWDFPPLTALCARVSLSLMPLQPVGGSCQ